MPLNRLELILENFITISEKEIKFYQSNPSPDFYFKYLLIQELQNVKIG